MVLEMNTIGPLLEHSGLVLGVERRQMRVTGKILLNGEKTAEGDPLPEVGDILSIRGFGYRVDGGGGEGRLQLVALDEEEPDSIAGTVRAHAGYHKCLTMYSRGVYERACSLPMLFGRSFRHFFHRSDAFYRECATHTIASVSGHAIDLDRFEDIRVVRVVRDPRDLLVSGYFYHKRGAEHWTGLVDPTDIDWMMVNGTVPGGLVADQSFTGYLQSVSMEEGLLAELEFRRRHFESMMAWPDEDERIRLVRYEDVIGNEAAVFRDILSFFDLPWLSRQLGLVYARRFRAAKRIGKSEHIRDVTSGQWRKYFTPALRERFDAECAELLAKLGYPVD